MTGQVDSPIGVLVMAHGTPASSDAIEPFYTSIRHGRPPTPELLAELDGRYRAIGGTSPLAERTRAQVVGLAARLESATPDAYLVRFGAKHTDPSIEEGMAQLVAAGVERVIGIVLTPHHSAMGSGEYLRRARDAAAAASRDVEFVPVPSWHRAGDFAGILADRTLAVLAARDPGDRLRTAVFFTAHSLPQRVVAEGDPYPGQVGETATEISARLRLDQASGLTWGVAWQSAGRTPEPWLGPDLLSEIERAAHDGAESVVVCPVGFVSDHLEILYDLDIEARAVARSAGVTFARTPSLNDDPRFLAVLARVVRSASGAPNAAHRVAERSESA